MRVLFIGNSYTFYNEMPTQVVQLARSIGTELCVQGGANVELHFKEIGAPDKITQSEATHVVLQDLSTGPLHSRQRFDDYMDKLGAIAKSHGAQVLVYQTWARAAGHEVYASKWSGGSPQQMTEKLRQAYAAIAEKIDATVVPVGDAWERCLGAQPQLVLHDNDLHHASPLGSHLAALTFFSVLTGSDPREADYVPPGVTNGDASHLRDHAWAVTQPAT